MSGVRPGQLWVSPDPETFYVEAIDYVNGEMTATVLPVRISGTGPGAVILPARGKGGRLKIKTSVMLEFWMPTTHEPSPAPTWHERILADDED